VCSVTGFSLSLGFNEDACAVLAETDILSPQSNPGPLARVANRFPSLEERALLAVLCREPLGYRIVRQAGSHRRLEARDLPPLTLAFHDRATIAPGVVRKILVDDVGLTEQEARRLL